MKRSQRLAGVVALATVVSACASDVPSALHQPTPEVCYDSREPPPCEGTTVVTLFVGIESPPQGDPWSSQVVSVIPEGEGVDALIRKPFDDALVDDFEVWAWDASGNRLRLDIVGAETSSVVIDDVLPDGTWEGGGYDSLDLRVALPGTAGIKKLQVLHEGEVTHETTAGPAAPVVEDVQLIAQEDSWRITWRASDPDGDTLERSVFLVDYNGKRELLSVGTGGFSASVPRRNLSGGA